MRRLILAAALAWATAARAGDLTPAYRAAWSDPNAFGAAQLQQLRQYQVLLVPGFLSDVVPDCFATQLAWLYANGVSASRVRVSGELPPDVNARAIARAIAASNKPVILIAHSKGGLDSLHALVEHPELRGKVKAWITIQSPLMGEPDFGGAADGYLSGQLARLGNSNPFTRSYVPGMQASVLSMSATQAMAYYLEHAQDVSAILDEIPTVAFGSSRAGRPGRPNLLFAVSGAALGRFGYANDGVVLTESTALPPMDFVRVAGVDHADTVDPASRVLDRVRFTKALLSLVLPSAVGGASVSQR